MWYLCQGSHGNADNHSLTPSFFTRNAPSPPLALSICRRTCRKIQPIVTDPIRSSCIGFPCQGGCPLLPSIHHLFFIRPGQVLGLVGTNGIGKSTALKVLAGKLKPNLGRFDVSFIALLAFFPRAPLPCLHFLLF